MHAKTRLPLSVFLCVLFVFAAGISGCKEKRKALVSAHAVVGELLASTKDEAKTLYAQKVIDEPTYQAIRINWLRAQTSYITASDILESVIDNDAADITAYTDILTQVNTILSDIAVWLSEPHPTQTPKPIQGVKHGASNDRSTRDQTRTPYREFSEGTAAAAGVERFGQGGAEEVSREDEVKGGTNNVGKLIVAMEYQAVYAARQVVTIDGITDKTAEVDVWPVIGGIVYTLDGTEPVLTDGVPHLKIHEHLKLNASDARKFLGKISMSGTKLCVKIVESAE